MSTAYREQLEWCLNYGEEIPFSYEEHSRQVVLEEIKGCLKAEEKGYEEPYMREDAAVEDMLWILKAEEEMEKGLFHDNQLPMDVAIVAPPSLMALLMGEYELAMLLCQNSNVTYWKNMVDEVYISNGKASMGSNYSFGEACMLCKDMSAQQLQFWAEKGYFDMEHLLLGNVYLYENTCLGLQVEKDEREQEFFWRPIYAVKKLCSVSESTKKLLALVLEAVIAKKLDTKCSQFWERLINLFTQKEERVVIMEVAHNYFYNSSNYIFSERLQKALIAYFKYEESLPMVGAIEKYIIHRVIAEFHKGPLFQNRLKKYFGVTKSFEGVVDREWKVGMLKLLKLNQESLFVSGFQIGFLKKECIEEYVSLLLKESELKNGSLVPIINRLIRMKWSIV